jgi:hypothetical protein
MVQARSPLFIVEAKCQGASTWVPLCVLMVRSSTAHASPPGNWLASSPGNIVSIPGSDCL